MKSWTTRGTWAALLCCVGLVCCVGMAYADRPDNSVEPVDWDVSPKGLLVFSTTQPATAPRSRRLAPDHLVRLGPLSRFRRSKPRRGNTISGCLSRTMTVTGLCTLQCGPRYSPAMILLLRSLS